MANLSDTFYAAEGKFHGYGAQLKVGSGDVGDSPQTYEAIAEITSISFGDMTTAVYDRTHLRSPEAHREKAAALRDSGAFTLVGNYRPDHESQSNAGGGSGSFTSGGLLALWRNRTEKDFIITIPYGSPEIELPFAGVVTKFQPGEIGVDDGVGFTAEITPLRDFSAALP